MEYETKARHASLPRSPAEPLSGSSPQVMRKALRGASFADGQAKVSAPAVQLSQARGGQAVVQKNDLVCEAPTEANASMPGPNASVSTATSTAATAPASRPATASPRPRATAGGSATAALDASKPATTVDDAVVRKMIDEMMGRAPGRTSHEKAQGAFAEANQLRNRHPNDMNLMAVEHYFYARSQSTGVVSGGFMAGLTVGYEAVKGALDVVGQRGLLSTDGTMPTPPSAAAVEWGVRGSVEGAAND